MSRTGYPPEAKARAVSALLLGGRPRVVAREHGIPESTVTTWRHRLKHGKLRHEKKHGDPTPFGALLMRHLQASLRSLTAQSQHMADPDLVCRLDAREAALLFGTLFDSTFRMLELLPGFLGRPELYRAPGAEALADTPTGGRRLRPVARDGSSAIPGEGGS